MRLFIDPEGEICAEPNLAAYAAIGDSLRGEALARYLVVNLGWVDFSVVPLGVKVSVRPRILTEASKVALFFALHDARATSIYLNILTQTWMTHRFASIQNLMALLTSLSASPPASHWLGDDRLLRVAVPAEKSCFSSILAQAAMVAYNVDDFGRALEILDRIMPAKWSICDRVGHDEISRVRAHNRKHQLLNPNAPVSDLIRTYADPVFARWVSDAHTSSLSSMTPRLEQVDAVARFSELGDVRLRYDVVTIPITRRDGSRILVCGSLDNCGIDLRQPLQKVA